MKIIRTVEAWPPLKIGKSYKGRVRQIKLNKKVKRLHVTIENIDSSMLGRMHEHDFHDRIYPGNSTSSFLSACGIDANTVGKQICLDDIVGIFIGMRFSAADGSDKEIEFKRIQPVAEDKAEDSTIEQEDQTLP